MASDVRAGKLADKVVLITGGTTGIGLASARLFAREGARVAVTGTNPENVARVTADFGLHGIRSDITKLADTEALVDEMRARYGRIDVLFSNAGMPGGQGPMERVDEATFDRVFATNVRGHFFTVQKTLPLIPNGGAIILTSSVAAHIGAANAIVYAASKAAIASLSRGLAAELIPRGIRVNTLTPGLIRTPIFDKFARPAEEIIDQLRANVPMRRAGEPEEVATAALFLACADSSFMTGSELRIAGGQTDL